MQEDSLRKVKKYMTETGMCQGCSMVILGVSGGPDSMTMLHILRELKDEFGYDIRVVHVNHGIRGEEALRDQKTVEMVCREWEIPCSVYAYDVPELASGWKMGEEEAGRKVRRMAFAQERSKTGLPAGMVRVALAHNQNDMAETMLHHLARGSGLRGLCSLKPLNGEIIRPLLCLERSEIVNYVKEHKIQTVLDSSNLEDDYTRNRIRRHILPLLEQEVNPKAVFHMAQAAERLGQAEDYFAGQAKVLARQYAAAVGTYVLDQEFFAKEEIIRTYVIREILEQISGHQKDLTSGHIAQIEELYGLQTGRHMNLPYAIEAARVYEGVRIWKKNASFEEHRETEKEVARPMLIPGETKYHEGNFLARIFLYNGEKILEKKYTKWFDCDKINCELSARTRRSGDFMVVNRSGGHKKLTRCMIDDKIPGELRDEIPLVADGNEIMWIVGGRINERYKITSETGRVLEITYQGGNVQ